MPYFKVPPWTFPKLITSPPIEKSLGLLWRRLFGLLWRATRFFDINCRPYPVPWTNESIVRVCSVIKWLSGIFVHVRIWCDQLSIWHSYAYQNTTWSADHLAFKCMLWSAYCLLLTLVWDHWLFGTQVCTVITDCLALKCVLWSLIVWHSSVCTDHDCLALKCVL